MKHFVILFLFVFLCSCGRKSISIVTDNRELSYNTPKKQQFKEQYYIFQNGTYEFKELDEKPEPVQGKKQFLSDMYRNISYPAMAREKGIQGTVLLEVLIDENGHINSVFVNKGVQDEIDTEAIRGFNDASQDGFKPFIYKGQPTKFKYILPVKFSLN